MSKIHQLPEHIIHKIAAGEVIERPSYAIKELIDNAIDAHATYITIQLEEGGLKKIIVTDNGDGMNYEDIQECFKPHTTSKLSTEEELFSIKSLGFRGEALGSIAAMSNMTIKSRIKTDPAGTIIEISSGKLLKISAVGAPYGTMVIIDNLFYNVPARKKFLKSVPTELRYISNVITHYALAYPIIRFFLSHNKKTILDLPKDQTITDRITTVYDNDFLHQVIPIQSEESSIVITGFISKPQFSTYNTSKQHLFVNGRHITDKVISLTIKDAYGNLLPPKAYPVFILFLTIPFEMVDVNIHPRKEQVNFINYQSILEQIKQTITIHLKKHNLTFSMTRWKTDPLYDPQTKQLYSPKSSYFSSYAGTVLHDDTSLWEVESPQMVNKTYMQIHDLFIVTQEKKGLILIDQHAAHERILYEELLSQYHRKQHTVYTLPEAVTIAFSPTEAILLEEYKQIFKQLGFVFHIQPTNSIQLVQVPFLFQDRDIQQVFTDILSIGEEGALTSHLDQRIDRIITYIACRRAIKAGEKLNKKQCRELVEKLAYSTNNATCPHGRPTKISIPIYDIKKFFKR